MSGVRSDGSEMLEANSLLSLRRLRRCGLGIGSEAAFIVHLPNLNSEGASKRSRLTHFCIHMFGSMMAFWIRIHSWLTPYLYYRYLLKSVRIYW